MKTAQRILSILKQTHPDAQCALRHKSAWQLLVATILSAQCTDERVNKVTSLLFDKYATPEAINKLSIEKLKSIIKSTGFYNSKAKNIKNAAAMIVNDYHGQVPNTMDKLVGLPGVGRKTANVILSVWFGVNEGVVVDTHVTRLSQRLGLSKNTNPEKIEKDLIKLYPRKEWERIGTLLIFHGRRICKARKPNCAGCSLNKICPSAFKVN